MIIAHLYAKYSQKNKPLADYCDSLTMFICSCETFLHDGILDSEVQIPGLIIFFKASLYCVNSALKILKTTVEVIMFSDIF